jgi:hypothetical protein
VHKLMFTASLPSQLFHHGAIKLAVAPVRSLRPLTRYSIVSPPPSLRLKRKSDREIDLENRRELPSLQDVASPSLLNHGGVGLVHVRGHAKAPTKPHELGVYDGGRARNLPRARGSRIPYSDGGIRRGMHGVLRAGILCAITPLSPLFVVVLWLGTSSLDPLGILHMAAFVTLCEACMGIEPHFNMWNYFFHTWLQQGSGVQAAAFCSVDIFVRSGHGVDLYFHLLTSGPPDRW